ncbi:MAG: hypothetical protein DBX97_22970 [Collinsella tanakaei]|nr:MAG: hypothetical protein DBX97_22970 [Collinsella tanakaei]
MYFLTVGPETPVAAAMPLTDSPLLALLLISSTLSTPIISFPDLLMSKSDRIDNCRSKAAVGAGLTISENFRLPEWKAAFTIFVNQTLPNTPNELWVTDITEFRLPCGAKCYPSPVIDCFDGRPVAWSIGRHPTARLANSSLEAACGTLAPGEAPAVHSDRGGHYRWPRWIAICEANGLARSMSRKGMSMSCVDVQ